MEENKTNQCLSCAVNPNRDVVLKAILTTTLLHFKKSLGSDLTEARLSSIDCPKDMETLKAYKTDQHLKFFVDALAGAIFEWHRLFFERRGIPLGKINN